MRPVQHLTSWLDKLLQASFTNFIIFVRDHTDAFFFFFGKILIPFTNLFCSFFLVSLVLSSKEVVTNCYGNEKRRSKNHGLCY